MSVLRNGIRMQETANKQKRITLKTLHEMLDGMSVELAEKVHLLFMTNYIDYSDYEFRDENQVEAIALALSPFARKTAELVNSRAYEAAASSCYAIFRCLAKTCKEHEDWFAGFTGYGDTYTKLAIFTEAVVELYCHLRQKPDLSKRMADEMDINLEVFNLETDFFGDLHCSSRFTDILCNAQTQYQDYSELDECPMWGMWLKEGGE